MTAVDRGTIVAAARRWIGTPYQHQASLIHVGCDCLGLVRGVWREVIGPEPEDIPPYTPDWAEAGAAETLLGAADRHFGPRRWTLVARATCCCFASARISPPNMSA